MSLLHMEMSALSVLLEQIVQIVYRNDLYMEECGNYVERVVSVGLHRGNSCCTKRLFCTWKKCPCT